MDRALVEKKLAFIETCARELSELARLDTLDTDVREQRFVQHTLQLAIQAVPDVSSHIVSAGRLGEPPTNRALFDLLAAAGLVDGDRPRSLQAMAGLRNILVHGYRQVDNAVVRDVVANRLPDLLAFVSAIRERVVR